MFDIAFVIASVFVELFCWLCVTDEARSSSFSRSLDAPIAERWRRQHRWIVAILAVLLVGVALLFHIADK